MRNMKTYSHIFAQTIFSSQLLRRVQEHLNIWRTLSTQQERGFLKVCVCVHAHARKCVLHICREVEDLPLSQKMAFVSMEVE